MKQRFHGSEQSAFTLIELLISISIIAVLMALLVPGLSSLRHGAKSVKCMANLRIVTFNFQVFANSSLHGDRGDSDRMLGPDQFYFEDFVDKQYRISEFWEGPGGLVDMSPSTDPMICPVSEFPLRRKPDTRCERGAITPLENVSYSFNRRLHQETALFRGRFIANRDTRVRSAVLDHPNVPIAFDVDGEAAANSRRMPYFTAPPVRDHDDYYSDGRWWFPSDRHRGKMIVVFVGGYLLSSSNAEDEIGWDWSYQPNPIREGE